MMPDLTGVSILFANNFAGPTMGGGEVQLLALIGQCVATGMRVTVAAQCGSALAMRAEQPGVTVVEIDFAPSRLLDARSELRVAIETANARIVQGTGFLTNILTRMAASDMNVRIVNVVHVRPGASLADGGTQLGLVVRKLAERATKTRVDRYVAVSTSVAEAVRRDFRTDSVTTIYNGIDVPAFVETASLPIAVRLPAGEGPLVGVIGRLERVKGVDAFLRAVPPVHAARPDARFVVAGAGSEVATLQELATSLGLGDEFAFLGHVEQVAPLMAALDVLVVPSRSEAFGLGALEAMTLGKPVVASAVGGLPEVVADGTTGILVAPADPLGIARAVIELLDDPQKRATMGEAGRRRVEEHFTLERMSREYLDLYAQLITGESSHG